MKSIVFTIGRFQGITNGHKKLIDKMLALSSKKNSASVRVYVSKSQDNKANPLSADFKIKTLQQIFPAVDFQIVHNPLFQLLRDMIAEGFGDITMVAGEDRIDEYNLMAEKYIRSSTKEITDSVKQIVIPRFQIISAGMRDENSDGTKGISGTKMRQFAVDGDFDSFLKHFPNKNIVLARNVFQTIRRNLIGEESQLTEGLYDQCIFKAIFVVGGAGSGKDYITAKVLGGLSLTEINSDAAFEFLLNKNNLSKIMTNFDPQKELLRVKAKEMTNTREEMILKNRLGIIINWTGDNPAKVFNMKTKLEKLGYDTAMMFVNTSNEVSKQRNIERGIRGGRTVPENVRQDTWNMAQKSIEIYRQMFKYFMIVDNSESLVGVNKRIVMEKFNKYYTYFSHFVAKPVISRPALNWQYSEMEKRHITNYDRPIRQQFGESNTAKYKELQEKWDNKYKTIRFGRNKNVEPNPTN